MKRRFDNGSLDFFHMTFWKTRPLDIKLKTSVRVLRLPKKALKVMENVTQYVVEQTILINADNDPVKISKDFPS